MHGSLFLFTSYIGGGIFPISGALQRGQFNPPLPFLTALQHAVGNDSCSTRARFQRWHFKGNTFHITMWRSTVKKMKRIGGRIYLVARRHQQIKSKRCIDKAYRKVCALVTFFFIHTNRRTNGMVCQTHSFVWDAIWFTDSTQPWL